MNLTTTRAVQTACAEPDVASRRLQLDQTIELRSGQRLGISRDCNVAAGQVQDSNCPSRMESDLLGLVLLGIGYESSVA